MRIRTIKPEFWLHEGICALPEFTRLLAIALLNWADDEGYFMANPAILRGSLFPFLDDSKKIPRGLQELSRVGWIDLGKDTQDRDVGRIRNFAKHQRVDKPRSSEIKASSAFQEASRNVLGVLQDASKEEWNGMEQGNGTGKGAGSESLTLPFASIEFKTSWEKWLKYRKEIKKPITPTMAETQLKNLEGMGEKRAIAMIENTIGKGWQGLREENEQPQSNQPQTPKFRFATA